MQPVGRAPKPQRDDGGGTREMHALHAAEAPEIVGRDHCAAVVSREPGLLREPHREQVVAKPVVTHASSRLTPRP